MIYNAAARRKKNPYEPNRFLPHLSLATLADSLTASLCALCAKAITASDICRFSNEILEGIVALWTFFCTKETETAKKEVLHTSQK